jgi:DNA repair photolyase
MIRKSKFLTQFPASPECPGFWRIAPVLGCPYKCGYCYLQKTLRCQTGLPHVYSNLDKLRAELEAALPRIAEPAVFNSGELGDSLAAGHDWLKALAPVFAAQKRHALLIVTKSSPWQATPPMNPVPGIIFSVSFNAPEIAAMVEEGAPHPYDRLAGLASVAAEGWRVRLRLDPIIPAPGWREIYARALHKVFSHRVLADRLERITLGTLRYLPGLPARSRRPEIFAACTESDGHRFRLPRELRMEMYGFLLRSVPPQVQLGLCKESKQVRTAVLGIVSAAGCNCMV